MTTTSPSENGHCPVCYNKGYLGISFRDYDMVLKGCPHCPRGERVQNYLESNGFPKVREGTHFRIDKQEMYDMQEALDDLP